MAGALAMVLALLAAPAPAMPAAHPARPLPGRSAGDNIVLEWNSALLEGVRRSTLGPPMVSRALAMAHTCMFDAWAAYDQKALGTRLGGALRRPPSERGRANRDQAISFAALRAARDLLPAGLPSYLAVMAQHGYDPADPSMDPGTPAGVGNLACQAVLDFRRHDGSNQLGDLNGGPPYSDYTSYAPANLPMDTTQPFDATTVLDPDRWQPLSYLDRSGALVTPRWLAPHWSRVVPFALSRPDQFRDLSGPVRHGSQAFVDQAEDLLDLSASLTDREKVVSQYWSDGPSSETPPGHWNLLAQAVSRRDGHGVNEDVQMFFALTNAVFDAGIAAWDAKIAFDCVRPITAVRHLFAGRQVRAWAGPGRGTATIDGADWLPYQPSWFPSPPFGEYVSGHSTFSAAAAEILRRFTGADTFGASDVVRAGSSNVEPGLVPSSDTTLSWPTFSAAAAEAGMSRRYGGIHFEAADVDGQALGRLVAAEAWEVARRYVKGSTPG